MRWPNPMIVCATALTLVLVGCDGVNIEATDLASVTVENDRTAIEKALGKPDEVVEVPGFTAASYTYDKGYYEPSIMENPNCYRTPRARDRMVVCLGSALFGFRRSSSISEVISRQQAKMVAVYDADEKLMFAGSLDKADPTSEKLTSIVIRYKATQTGDADALISLSEIAFIPKQQRTFLKTAANSGSAEAQHRLASLVTEDADKIGWLRKAAAQDHIRAQIDLGTALLYAPDDLVDRTEAKVWLTKAAEAGNSNAKTELAKLSRFETNLAHAERGEPDAQYALGNAYDNGQAVERDPGVALQWWQRAAESGHPMAQVTLAKHYRAGIGVPADKKVAEEWSRKAEEQDDPEVLEQLADMYRFTISEMRNTTKAVSLYKRAAAAGSRASLFDLGSMHEHGLGIQADYVLEHMWYALAELQGHGPSKVSRDRIAQELSHSEVAEAEQLKREWLAAHPR